MGCDERGDLARLQSQTRAGCIENGADMGELAMLCYAALWYAMLMVQRSGYHGPLTPCMMTVTEDTTIGGFQLTSTRSNPKHTHRLSTPIQLHWGGLRFNGFDPSFSVIL